MKYMCAKRVKLKLVSYSCYSCGPEEDEMTWKATCHLRWSGRRGRARVELLTGLSPSPGVWTMAG